MNKIKISSTFAAVAALMAVSCSQEPVGVAKTETRREVRVALSLGDTRAIGHQYRLDEYLGMGNGAEEVTLISGDAEYAYVSDGNGMLNGKDGNVLCFPADGGPLYGIEIYWPAGATEPANAAEDQSDRVTFMKEDRLQGAVTDIQPSAWIPVRLHHARARITFTLTGEFAGKRIEELTVGGYKAYCDPELNDAQLILDPVKDLEAIRANTRCIVGIEGVAEPVEYFITMDLNNRALAPGRNLTINL